MSSRHKAVVSYLQVATSQPWTLHSAQRTTRGLTQDLETRLTFNIQHGLSNEHNNTKNQPTITANWDFAQNTYDQIIEKLGPTQ